MGDRIDTFPIPPTWFPIGSPAQLSCMRAVSEGLRHCSRRDLERLVKAVAAEVNEINRKAQKASHG